jgi:hypothetical protein
VRSRSEADQEDLCSWIAKAWIWFSPVAPIREPPGFFSGDLLAPSNKPGAESALNDLLLDLVKLSHSGLSPTSGRKKTSSIVIGEKDELTSTDSRIQSNAG